jgi:hypothetical protein
VLEINREANQRIAKRIAGNLENAFKVHAAIGIIVKVGKDIQRYRG